MNEQKSGILDNTTQEVVVLTDDKITLRSNVKIYGVLEAGLVRTTELIADQRYEKQFLQFASPDGDVGAGLLWINKNGNRQFIFRNNPDRFWLTESVDIPQTQSFMIGGTPAISYSYLGNNVVSSNLQSLGDLKKLTVNGPVKFGDGLTFNPISNRLGIGLEEPNAKLSVYDEIYDVEIVAGTTDGGNGKIGTYNSKSFDIVTDNQTRLSVDMFGNITIGHETKDNTVTRVYGKLSVGVKNPKESLEVSGNIRWANKLFASGNSAPDSGTYQRGDIVWNSEPKPNSYIGWVCTSAGSPGLWRPFALIAA
jgi:hypothetical protein